MEHLRLTIKAGSQYEGRQCPVSKQELTDGAVVVVCPVTDTAMAEMVFLEQSTCPYCSGHVALAAAFPAAKPPPRRYLPPGGRSPVATTALIGVVVSLLTIIGVVVALISSGILTSAGNAAAPSVNSPDVSAGSTSGQSSQNVSVAESNVNTVTAAPVQQANHPTGSAQTQPPVQQVVVAAPTIISRATWGAAMPQAGMIKQQPVRIVLTHEEGSKCCDGADVAARVKSNERVHRDTRGWPDIAFHFIISPAGDIYEGRAVGYRADSSYAAKNPDYQLDGTIVLGLLGNYNIQQPTNASIDATVQLMAWLCQQYNIAPDQIYYLRDVAPVHIDPEIGQTTSPGTDMLDRQQIRDAVRARLTDR